MKPNEVNDSRNGGPLLNDGLSLTMPKVISQPDSKSSDQAATNIIRGQIDNIYAAQNNPSSSTVSNSSSVNHDNISRVNSQKTHTEIQNEQWKQYHTAWQNYYQTYYQNYYQYHYNRSASSKARTTNEPFSSSNHAPETPIGKSSKTDELFDLRQALLTKVRDSAKDIKKSRHFIPALSGFIAVILLLFIQYNQFMVANVVSYISPGSIDAQSIVISPINSNVKVGPDPKLIIPKINVDVPVSYDIGNDYESQMAAMEKGLAHFAVPGANSHPGQIGNTVLAGHSSNDLFSGGSYKFIFAQLDKLNKGDTVYANYNSIRYTYVVTGKSVVKPTDVAALTSPTTKPILTLLTCTPVGTAQSRLLVTAEQISPSADNSMPAPKEQTVTTDSMPGSSPTLIERLFGL